jgi:hypothetical protein
MRRLCFYTIISIYLGVSAWFCVQHFTRKNLPEKSSLYLDSNRVVDAFSPPKNPNELIPIFDGKYQYYDEKLHSFYANIQLTIAFCILGCVLLFREQDVGIPGFPILRIPCYVTYLVVPAALMYFWLTFGFQLHHLIDTRISLFSLIESQYALSHFKEVASPDGTSNHFQYLYSLTRANDLRDTGFLDAWFLTFLPKYFATAPMSTMDMIVPKASMIAVGCLFGISHGLALGMPFNWVTRYPMHNKKPKWIAILLLVINLFFILSSHLTFYFTGRNYNWLTFFILGVGGIVFVIVTASEKSKTYRAAKAKPTEQTDENMLD